MNNLIEFAYGGINFRLTTNYHPDNSMPEIVVACGNIGDNMVVFAFEDGGLTLCGDSVHLAVDGDEMWVGRTTLEANPHEPWPIEPLCCSFHYPASSLREFEPAVVPEQNRYSFVPRENYA